MPFGYFGSKHGLAKFYPEPRYLTVVEPFCGAAGYSVYWAKQGKVKHAILTDINPNVVMLWKRLQKMSVGDLMAIPEPVKGESTTEPLIAAASGEQGMAVMRGKSRMITDRMVSSWPRLRNNLIEALPLIRKWDVECADYNNRDMDTGECTWFIDPPYTHKKGQVKNTAGGESYTSRGKTAAFKDYERLAEFAKSRNGQVIVCEQEPADWLPFRPFRNQRNGVGAGTQSTRTELVWTNDGDLNVK